MITLVLPHLYLVKNYKPYDLEIRCIEQKNDIDELEISGTPLLRTIKLLQCEPFVVSFLGGISGKNIRKSFIKNNIKSKFIFTRIDTELKVNIVDNDKQYALFGEEPKQIIKKEYSLYKTELNNFKNLTNVVVIDEEYFKSNEKEFYNDILKFYKNDHYKVIVNTNKYINIHEISKHSTPYAIKVTLDKDDAFSQKSKEDIVKLYADYIQLGIHYVAVDIVGKGAILISKNKTCYIETEHKLCCEKVFEAKDAFLGAMAVGIARKYEQEKILKLAFSTSLAVLKANGINYCTQNDIMLNKKNSKISELYNKKKKLIS
ncbi:MAG: hypothetical protein A2Y24_08805 [Clostridiales bacterium GWE2_32_10]|nr:MAG: hypothetical protein A2Y24_08805 [Clostridiales bacterium GWE2_32_10]